MANLLFSSQIIAIVVPFFLRGHKKSRRSDNASPTMSVVKNGKSIVLGLDLEVGLGMVAHGAHLGSLLANHHVAAVAALPNGVTVA